MPLKVLPAANLRKYVPGHDPATGHSVEASSPVTVLESPQRPGIPHEELGLIVVNGVGADRHTRPVGDEQAALFPLVGGD